MPTFNGAQILVHLLERQGVSTVFGLPGGAALPLYDALHGSRLRHVLARQEQGAGFMAQGCARATGQVGVALSSSGPGTTNLLTAIADAKLDSIPALFITAQVPTALIGTDAFQEVDACALAKPITKACFFVRRPEELLRIVPEAFRLALSGRPGPVLIDFPKDAQLAKLDVEHWPAPGTRESPPQASASSIGQAAALLAQSERPILYLGGGISHAGAAELAQRFAEEQDLPTVLTLMALGSMAPEHPLCLGMLGMHAAPYTNQALEDCDLLLAVGARFDDRATGKLEAFSPRAKVIHIDIDARELGKLRQPQVAIQADAKEALSALRQALPPRSRHAWRARVQALKDAHPRPWGELEGERQPVGLLRACAKQLPEATVTTDVGQHQMWAAQAYPLRHPRRWLTSGGLGTMGFGLPAAIGAALADRSRPVLCISGDGSLLMNLQEMVTAIEQDLDIKVLLMDNRSLGLVYQQQDLFYGQRRMASAFHAAPDWLRLARAFGWQAWDLGAQPDVESCLDEALHAAGPVLLRAPIDIAAKVFPMVPPGAANKDMLLGGSAR